MADQVPNDSMPGPFLGSGSGIDELDVAGRTTAQSATLACERFNPGRVWVGG